MRRRRLCMCELRSGRHRPLHRGFDLASCDTPRILVIAGPTRLHPPFSRRTPSMSFRVIRVLLTTSCFATFAMAALAVEPIAADKRARHPEQAPAFTMVDSGCGGEGNLADVQCL